MKSFQMGKKRQLRKVYFIAEKNQLFRNIYCFVKLLREEAHAKNEEVHRNKRAVGESTMIFNRVQPPSIYKAVGFYLVHESLLDKF